MIITNESTIKVNVNLSAVHSSLEGVEPQAVSEDVGRAAACDRAGARTSLRFESRPLFF